jgi:hypothetical protein
MDHIAPTLERARHAGDTWEPLHHDKRAGTVKPARQVSRFVSACDRGNITEGEREAGLRYERHMELASRSTVTQSYGQHIAEGTPIGQLAYDDSGARMVDYYVLHKQAVDKIGRGNAEFLALFLAGERVVTLGGGGRTETALARFWARLRMILRALELHYGMKRSGEP